MINNAFFKIFLIGCLTYVLFIFIQSILITLLCIFFILIFKHSKSKEFKFTELLNDLLGMLIGMIFV